MLSTRLEGRRVTRIANFLAGFLLMRYYTVYGWSRHRGVPAGDLRIEAGNELIRRTTISQELADPLIGMIG